MALPIGLQLWSLRDACSEDFFGTIRRVAELGFAGVEFAGFYGHRASEVKRVLDGCGLRCAGSHLPIEDLSDENVRATLEFHKELACPYVIVPSLPSEMRDTAAALDETCAAFRDIVERVAEEGLHAGFHNHECDMAPVEGGKSAWDRIAEQTPDGFVLQYDTGNGKMGGFDEADPIAGYPGRAKTVHLKGYPPGTPVGEGPTDWPKVFAACEGPGGTEWLIVEHEQYDTGPPFECVQKCVFNLRHLGKM